MSNDQGEFDAAPTESKTTGTVGNFLHGSRETPVISDSSMEAERREGARPQFRHARHRGVRQFHSTKEAGEQRPSAKACGVGGGKGTDQGEHRAIATGPDTEPELRRETVGSQVARIAGCTCSLCTSTSEVRAVCGNSARTDLCGGAVSNDRPYRD